MCHQLRHLSIAWGLWVHSCSPLHVYIANVYGAAAVVSRTRFGTGTKGRANHGTSRRARSGTAGNPPSAASNENGQLIGHHSGWLAVVASGHQAGSNEGGPGLCKARSCIRKKKVKTNWEDWRSTRMIGFLMIRPRLPCLRLCLPALLRACSAGGPTTGRCHPSFPSPAPGSSQFLFRNASPRE